MEIHHEINYPFRPFLTFLISNVKTATFLATIFFHTEFLLTFVLPREMTKYGLQRFVELMRGPGHDKEVFFELAQPGAQRDVSMAERHAIK